MQEEQRQTLAMRVSIRTIFLNLALAVMKLAAGLIAHSGALLSDAANSASDVVSTMVVMLGVRIAGKESDSEHPYGHERMECVAALCLAVLLFITGTSIGIDGIRKLIAGQEQGFVTPGVLALAAALLTIVVKAFMYRWTIRVARQINSTSLRASALDHRSDVIASAGTFFGIAATRFGFPSMDTIASVLISGLIVRTAYDIARQSFDQMLDRACPPDVEEALHQVVERQHGVRTVDRLTTRQFGPRYYVDVSIACDSDLTIGAGHEIANQVHDEIEKNFPDVKHCMVHVNPYRRRPDGPGTVQ